MLCIIARKARLFVLYVLVAEIARVQSRDSDKNKKHAEQLLKATDSCVCQFSGPLNMVKSESFHNQKKLFWLNQCQRYFFWPRIWHVFEAINKKRPIAFTIQDLLTLILLR